ncbi:hypothetical protein DUNSADRAFT_4167 [Dunaliella salina]|uniref:NOL1/NOP2/Sun domain family member 4 n=1 Tax=Dunaliella salina TaxID=3046 RepID=A0ABQ7GSK3_DUNSA|nr:hypothetical protein DUNSADRAFT_4167 [Dunaliella salina]|eukprot:KAF5837597.1 hypothetical protein DUNSADRAFT_4167 [Dunaliella salina]
MPPTGKRPGSAKTEDSSAEFDKYFSQQFGVARWRSLAKSLQKETTHVALLNQFALNDSVLDGMKPSLFVGNIKCFRLPQSPVPIAGAQPELDEKTALRTHYWMDLASVYPVVLLDAQPGMTVLDAAAAPGGKSLVLAHQMFAPSRRAAPPSASLQGAGEHHVSETEEGLQGQGTAEGSLSGTASSGQDGEHRVSKLEEGLQGEGTAKGSMLGTASSGQHGLGQGPGLPLGTAAPDATGALSDTAAPGAAGVLAGTAVPGAAGVLAETAVQGAAGAPEETAAPGAAGPTREGSAKKHEGLHRGEGLAGPGQALSSAKGGGLLMVNEPDATRRTRLQRVLTEYLPHALVAGSAGAASGKRSNVGAVRVIGHEAEKSCARRGLIPARDWSLMQCRQLAALQLQLLLAGLRALAVGGRLVYSTCSLAAMENDGVVSKALERFPDVCVVMPSHPNYFPASLVNQPVSLQETFSPEATKHGVLLMPDLCGHGPIYVSVLEKRKDQVDLQRVANIEPSSSLQPPPAGAAAGAAARALFKAPPGSNPRASISPLLLP